jgi:hypothetical protein
MSGILSKENITAEIFQDPMAYKQLFDLITVVQNRDICKNIYSKIQMKKFVDK